MGGRLRYTGVLAVAVLWTTLPAASALAGFDLLGGDPISYLGTQGPSAALFTAGLAVSAVLLVAFHRYVRERYRVAPAFSVAMLVGLAGQLVAAFVPIGGDAAAHRIHTTSALVLGASLPVFMWRFAAAQPVGPWRRAAYVLFWVEAAACAAGLYLSSIGVAALAEVLPAAAFHTWILVLTLRGGAERGSLWPAPAASRPGHGPGAASQALIRSSPSSVPCAAAGPMATSTLVPVADEVSAPAAPGWTTG